ARRAHGARRARGARGLVPRSRVPRLSVALRRVRPARAGSHGLRHSRRRSRDGRAARGRGRRGDPRRAREPDRDRRGDPPRSGRARSAGPRGPRAGSGVQLGRDRTSDARRLPGARVSSAVAAVVVTHGAGPELARCLEALTPQVDELVVVANPPAPSVDARVIVNERALGFAANANKGIAATTAPFVVVANPDTVPREGAVEVLRKFAEVHPRAGIVGPGMLFPDGRWQPSRRRFPTVSGTIVRRTPLRKLLRPETRQLDHYLLEDRPTEP